MSSFINSKIDDVENNSFEDFAMKLDILQEPNMDETTSPNQNSSIGGKKSRKKMHIKRKTRKYIKIQKYIIDNNRKYFNKR